jgi:hypothetical protein
LSPIVLTSCRQNGSPRSPGRLAAVSGTATPPVQCPADPLGVVVAQAVGDVLAGAGVELHYAPDGSDFDLPAPGSDVASAIGPGPPGWQMSITVRLDERVARLVANRDGTVLAELLAALPDAGARAAARFRRVETDGRPGPARAAIRRAVRDTVAAEILTGRLSARLDAPAGPDLVGDTIEYLLELSGTRVESHDLTHGVVVTDRLHDKPRLQFRYPADVRAAKRAPLLFDGQRAVLLVDTEGRARTELQRHRFDRLVPGFQTSDTLDEDAVASGAVVAEATRALGGLGFFLRADRSIWTFVDGRPLLVRRGEHWTAFPLELRTAIDHLIGGGAGAALVAQAAFMISAQPRGAILAIVDGARELDGIVSAKDRYDLRNDIDPAGMRPETKLHHLIETRELDVHTLVRLATLDGATVLDRGGGLVAYGAVVTSSDSQHEGARTAAARTLSETALIVLKVSVDGDITIFHDGAVVTTLLRTTSPA